MPKPYLHSLRIPLAEVVALDEAELGEDGQRDGFGNECEGHCGVCERLWKHTGSVDHDPPIEVL